jgi:hypothetical protein
MAFATALVLLMQTAIGPADVLADVVKSQKAWEICVRLHATNYAQLSESADVLAEAALGKCSTGETEFRNFVSKLKIADDGRGFDIEHLESVVSNERASIRSVALTTILDARIQAKDVKK